MNHQNVLSVEGVAPKLFDFCMVSRWMVNGNILNYVRKNPAADRLRLVRPMHRWSYSEPTRVKIVARGHPRSELSTPQRSRPWRSQGCAWKSCSFLLRLTHYRSQSNILIDADGSPRISDYGLSSITKNDNSFNASTPDRDGTIRYRAPELFATDGVTNVEKKRPTTKSDVYSLSMVIVEVRPSSERISFSP